MQIQVVWYYCGVDDVDGQVQCLWVGYYFGMWDEVGQYGLQWWCGQYDLDCEVVENYQQQCDDECFQCVEIVMYQQQYQYDVYGCDDCVGKEWNVEQQFQCNGGIDDFGQVIGDDCYFVQQLQVQVYWLIEMVVVGLGEVVVGGDVQLC